MSSPTARTLAALRKRGWTAGVTERYCHITRRRHDLYGWMDVMGYKDGMIVGVQCTDMSSASKRLGKLAALDTVKSWVNGSRNAEVWGWAKRRGKWAATVWRASLVLGVVVWERTDAMSDAWMPIAGYEGSYEVGSSGVVRSLVRTVPARNKDGTISNRKVGGRPIGPHVDSSGYKQVRLCSAGNTSRLFLLHRLVAEAFIPNPEGKPQVNHKDGNPKNNSADNLEWATPSEDSLHATRVLGRVRGPHKLTKEDVIEIRRRVAAGETQKQVAFQFGITSGAMSSIISRRRWAFV